MSNRLNLREFQQNLIDRLQAKDMSDARVSTLGMQIAGRNWLVWTWWISAGFKL